MFENPQNLSNNNSSRECAHREQGRVELNKNTYIVKEESAHQLIAFNGSKYMIICRSKRMYIVVICDIRKKCQQAAEWLNVLCEQLMKKGH